MALDIKTVYGRCVGLPFDWQLVSGQEETLIAHDMGDHCAGIQAESRQLLVRDLAVERGLHTAVILSLFSDRRAGADDLLPLNVTDRRGWCGDEFGGLQSDEWGSHLWLGYYTKRTDDWLDFMRFAAEEALAHLVKRGLVDHVVVQTAWLSDERMGLTVSLYESTDANPVYRAIWNITVNTPPAATCLPFKEPFVYPPVDPASVVFTWPAGYVATMQADGVGADVLFPSSLHKSGYAATVKANGVGADVLFPSAITATDYAATLQTYGLSAAALMPGQLNLTDYTQTMEAN